MENKIPVTRTVQGLGIPPLQEQERAPYWAYIPMDGMFFFSFDRTPMLSSHWVCRAYKDITSSHTLQGPPRA